MASCYEKVLSALRQLGIEVAIHPIPNKLVDPIPFHEDHTHATYDPEQAVALHQALLRAQEVCTRFRSEFRRKCSPVHFSWGSFDLAQWDKPALEMNLTSQL